MSSRWYPETRRFMRALLRAGGSRLVSQRSKFRALAMCLRREGMLELASYAGGVAHYRATERGRAEFADSRQVGTDAAVIQNGELSSELR
jgi:hypothetical protein